ncbi:hypothetical protein RJP21_12755 [Paenibacillus sp. VCA1]|uniref:hypothetical protein n=1 Tax=Paenibacillus sp. VCA1 TaxID=3039148 RepID=UPI002870EA1F|nr:hypothetical protein [Paenibacillus sp. VCA1]MDR9854475.1 hypothetical protein [Paenibacillus sp. VCA1]
MPVKICPGCGASNDEKAGSCIVCGASLEQVKAVRPLKTGNDFDILEEDPYVPSRNRGLRFDLSGSGWLMAMLVVATVIYPILGMIVGGLVALLGDHEEKRNTGKLLLLLGLIIWLVRVLFVQLLMR